MTDHEFEKWCIRNENKLKRYRVIYRLYGLFPLLLIVSVFGLALLIQNEDLYIFVTLAIVLLSIFIISYTSRHFPLTKSEYISCLLNKIAEEIKFYKTSRDKINLKSDIKALQNYADFTLKFPNSDLFKEDINKQVKFYKLLKSLPSRLLYKVENNLINEMKHEDIRDLAYHIYNDSETKMEILDKIANDNPDMTKRKLNIISDIFRKILTDKFIQLSLVILFLVVVFYYLVYGFLGIEKNTATLGCITLIAVSAYIIFKK
jgi:hypothetical protein